jgi:hypothetical protein
MEGVPARLDQPHRVPGSATAKEEEDMSRERIEPDARAEILRELISDATSETPRTMEDGADQQGAVRFLQRKLNELETQVITGD